MELKKIFEDNTPEDLAEAFVFPTKLSAKAQLAADKQLAEHREKQRSAMTEPKKLYLRLLQLRYDLENYVKEDYNPQFTTGYFLERYLKVINKKKKDFALDIQIHETLLSQLLKDRREPNYSFLIRLELHSNNIIPAITWFKVIEKEKEHLLVTDQSLRDKESRYVKNSLQLV